MKTKNIACFLSILAPMLIASLMGCNPSSSSSISASSSDLTSLTSEVTPSTSEDDNKDVRYAIADPIHFVSNGLYKTSINGLKAKGLTIADLDLRCVYQNEEKQELYKHILITNLIILDDSSIQIEFKDDTPYLNDENCYDLYIAKINTAAKISILEKKALIEAEESFISSHDDNQIINLKLNDSKFLDVKREDIRLSGGLKNFEVTNLVASSDKLSLNLKGRTSRVKGINIYEDGEIIVSPRAIKDVNKESIVSIPIEEDMLYFDQRNLKYNNGDVTIPLIVSGEIDPLTLNKTDIVFEKDAVVKAIVNEVDKVYLILSVNGASDANSAAKILNGQVVKVKDTSFISNTSEVTFKVNQEDLYLDNKSKDVVINLTLISHAGYFDKDINRDNFTFDGGLKNSKINNLKLVNSTTMTLDLYVPYDENKDVKDFDVNGDIIITNGLNNLWGDVAKSVVSKRNYKYQLTSNDSIDTFSTIIMTLMGGEGAFTGVGAVATGASSAFLGAKLLLQLTGSETSSDDYYDKLENMIKESSNAISDILNRQNQMLTTLQLTTNLFGLSGFNQNLNELTYWNSKMDEYWSIAMQAVGKSPDKNASKEVWSKYDKDIQNKINEFTKNDDPRFKQYDFTAQRIEDLYVKIASAVKPSSADNPLLTFDRICSETYNFDTLAKEPKELFRALIRQCIARALVHILNHDYYDGSKTMCHTVRKAYEEATRNIDKHSGSYTVSEDASKIYFYTVGHQVWNKESEQGFTTDAYKEQQAYVIKNYDSQYLYCFTDQNVVDFQSRMVWSTIRKELKYAKFYHVGLTSGVAFTATLQMEDAIIWKDHWFRYVYMPLIHVRYIPWDSNTLTKDHLKLYSTSHKEWFNKIYRFYLL